MIVVKNNHTSYYYNRDISEFFPCTNILVLKYDKGETLYIRLGFKSLPFPKGAAIGSWNVKYDPEKYVRNIRNNGSGN